MRKKNLSGKKFGPKKMLVQKRFGPKFSIGQNKFLAQKKVLDLDFENGVIVKIYKS